MRIADANIPEDKRLVVALTYIKGVGPKRSTELCGLSKIDESVRVKDLTPEQQEVLRKVVLEQGWLLESELRRAVSQDVKRLQDIGSYRGYRHRRRLPVRGQRTKTNSRTKRGKRGTVANKKK